MTEIKLTDGNNYIDGGATIKSIQASINEPILLMIANEAIDQLRDNPHDVARWVFSGDAYEAKMLDQNTLQIDVTFVFQAVINNLQLVLSLYKSE